MIGMKLEIPLCVTIRIDAGLRQLPGPRSTEPFHVRHAGAALSIFPIQPRFVQLQRLVKPGNLQCRFVHIDVAAPSLRCGHIVPLIMQISRYGSGQFPPAIIGRPNADIILSTSSTFSIRPSMLTAPHAC